MASRRLSEKASHIVFGTGSRALSDILIAIVLVRLLPASDYGSFRQVVLVFGTLGVLASLGLPASLYYFIPRHDERGGQRILGRVSAVLGVTALAGAALVYLLAFPLGRAFGNPDLPGLLRVGAVFPIGLVLYQIAPHYLVARGRHREAGMASAAVALGQAVAALLPAVLGHGLWWVVLGYALFWLLAALVAGLYLLIRGERPVPFGSPVGASQLLGYSVPLSLNSMVATINQRVDRYIISVFHTPEVFAVFAVGATELPIVMILPYAIGNTLVPAFAQMDADGGREKILPVWHRGIGKVALLIMPLFAFFFLFAHDFIAFVFTPRYGQAADIFRIYLLLLPVRVASYGTVLQALGATREVLVAAVIGLVTNVVLGLWLHQLLGWTGPAWASVAAQLVMIGFLLWRIARHLDLPLGRVFPARPWLRSILTAAPAAAVGAALLLLEVAPGVRLALAGGAMTLTFLATVAATGALEPADRRLLTDWLTLRVFRS